MVDLAVFLLAALAVARITHLVNADAIAAGLRARVISRYGPDSKRAYLVNCPWCVSPYAAAVVLSLAYVSHGAWWFTLPAGVLTISYLVGVAEQLVAKLG